MLGLSEGLILGKILAGILSDIVKDIVKSNTESVVKEKYTDFIKLQGKFVNYQLEKALRRSFVLAQYSIASECRRELVQSSRMVYGRSSRLGTLEHEADIRLLNKKLKQLKEELNKVKQLKANATPIESLNDLGLLLTEEGKLDEKRVDIKNKLLAEALVDNSVACYKAKVEASLLERICAYFAFEIKTNPSVRDILQTQLLAQINLKSENLEKSLLDVAQAVPDLVNKLDNWWVAIQSNLDKIKTSLEDLMEIVTGTAKTVEQIDDKLDKLIEAKSPLPPAIYVIVIPGNLNEIQPQLPSIVARLQQASGDVTAELIDIKKGSVLLFFEGSQEGFEQLEVLFRDGELQQVLDCPVEAVESIANNTFVFVKQLSVNLSQWLDNVIDTSWRTVEDVLGTQRANLVFADRGAAGVVRAIPIDVGTESTGVSLALVVEVIPTINGERDIRLQVHPTNNQTFLLPGIKCIVLDTSGKTLLEVEAKNTDRWIQLNINGKPLEQFSVQIQLGDVTTKLNFVI